MFDWLLPADCTSINRRVGGGGGGGGWQPELLLKTNPSRRVYLFDINKKNWNSNRQQKAKARNDTMGSMHLH